MALHSDHLPELELAGRKSLEDSSSQKDSNQQKSERQDNTLKLYHNHNRPFYSCLLSDLVSEWQQG